MINTESGHIDIKYKNIINKQTTNKQPFFCQN